jgi:hypothetical protein
LPLRENAQGCKEGQDGHCRHGVVEEEGFVHESAANDVASALDRPL